MHTRPHALPDPHALPESEATRVPDLTVIVRVISIAQVTHAEDGCPTLETPISPGGAQATTGEG